jgi:hypothetical protein
VILVGRILDIRDCGLAHRDEKLLGPAVTVPSPRFGSFVFLATNGPIPPRASVRMLPLAVVQRADTAGSVAPSRILPGCFMSALG